MLNLLEKNSTGTMRVYSGEDGGLFSLYSYVSRIIDLLPFEKTMIIYPNFEYSKTTVKHLNRFLYNYFDRFFNIRNIRKARKNKEFATFCGVEILFSQN